MAIQSPTITNPNAPQNEAQIAEEQEGQRVATGATDNTENTQTIENQEILVVQGDMDEAAEKIETASMDLAGFLTSFGLLSPEGKADASSFDKIKQLLKNLEEALNTLRSAYAESATEASVAGFDISMKGVEEMLDHAQNAFNMAIASGVMGIVSQGAVAGYTGKAVYSAEVKRTKFPGNQENFVFMQVKTQVASTIGGMVQGGTKITDGAAQQATTEGQAASKEADAEAQLMQTIRDQMEEIRRALAELIEKLDNARAGTNQADRAFRTKA
ncbi:MAG TPA: hypothetical protein DHW71_03745 [Gammaproteobacteria bacterium]|nr:hypothetical protein [Pseudomonadota bacterium]HBF07332.1 hypothetical protein [Gammaproteobacteria bacterium]HCK92072.1 hypothetical protein [Gammaproteobacteria bacterium]|tara:strand:+ start:1040 stop:1855 length:816 start_codon:yes stop_codon:yes gene_type:complete